MPCQCCTWFFYSSITLTITAFHSVWCGWCGCAGVIAAFGMSLFLLVKSASVASVSQLGVVEGEGEGAEVHLRLLLYLLENTSWFCPLPTTFFTPVCQFLLLSFVAAAILKVSRCGALPHSAPDPRHLAAEGGHSHAICQCHLFHVCGTYPPVLSSLKGSRLLSVAKRDVNLLGNLVRKSYLTHRLSYFISVYCITVLAGAILQPTIAQYSMVSYR